MAEIHAMPSADDPSSCPPPIGDPRRSAWDKLRGYRYQLWYAVLLWIRSGADRDVYVETAEDVDLTSPDQLEAHQLKDTAASLSLNTEAAMKALRDYWNLSKLNNPRQVRFNYITTGAAALEENASFSGHRKGLDVWEGAKTSDADLQEIRTFLLARGTKVDPERPDKPKPLPDDLIALLQNGSIEDLRANLVNPITWQTSALTMDNLIVQVEEAIFEYSDRINDPLLEESLGELKRELHSEAFEVATSKLERKLTARRFADLFKKKTHVTIPRAWRPAQAEALLEQPAPEPPVLPLDWKVPTSDLEEWPTAVGNNRELERPELERIKKAIKENQWSAHLILGEAGAGKSALMANLTKALAQDRVPYLALKADCIDSDVDSLETLVPGLSGQSLANAIKTEAKRRPFVVVVDQLDALCALTEKKTKPLTMVLGLLRELAQTPNIHIAASCRLFEFTSDLRLKTLNASKIELELPTWDKVAALLREEGVNPDQFTKGSRDVLRVPWNLKLYLSLPAPRPVLNSFYELVEAVWDNAMKKAQDPQRCLDLVDRIAHEIDRLENFWIPLPLTDGYVHERSLLLSEGILLRPQQLSRIGFRHQTFYDYFLLGSFQRQHKSISEYIDEHNQSFFIRPTVTRALAYQREMAPQLYCKNLTELMAPGRLRRHLRYLVIEFVGKQHAPSPEEVALFLPMLDDEATGRQFLQAIGGSKGWFDALLGTKFETQWVGSTARALMVTSFLATIITNHEDDVVSLILARWWPNPAFDSAALWTLSYARNWNPGTIRLVENYAERGRVDDALWTLTPLVRKSPESSAKTIGTLFRRKADEVLTEIAAEAVATPVPAITTPSQEEFEAATPAQATEIAERIFAEDPTLKKIKTLLTSDQFHHSGLSLVADRDCEGFLKETWAKTKEMLGLVLEKKPEAEMKYEDDGIGVERYLHSDRGESILDSVEKALEKMAATAPAKFQAWAHNEKTESSLTIHRLIAIGALQLPTACADWIVSYLLEDKRRLFLGGIRDDSEDTKPLIARFVAHASPQLREALNTQIVEIPATLLEVAKKRYPSGTDERRVEVLRRDRAQLLKEFPQDQRPASGQTAFDADVADFGQPYDPRPLSVGGWVGAPVKAEEFVGKSEGEIFDVLDKYPDDCARDPTWNFTTDVSRSGGVFQQAQAFAGFAETHVEVARVILKRLQPGRHEKYASAILRKWIDPKQDSGRSKVPVIKPSEIEQLILKLAADGFKSENFRIEAAHVLQTVAKLNEGLTAESLEMLKIWLPETKLPEPETYEPHDRKELEHSILYSAQGGWTVPTGRGPIVEAIIIGSLYQKEPKIEEAISFLEELFKTERHLAVWAEALIHTPWLFNRHSERMTILAAKLFETMPELLTYSQVFYFLGQIAGNVTPIETEESWITKLLARQDDLSHLLAGELTILHFIRCHTKWAKDLIGAALADPKDEQFFRGITFGAAAFVSDKTLSTDVEPILVGALRSPSAKIRDAALTFIRHIDEKSWTASAKRLVDQILKANLAAKGSFEVIASQMEQVALVDPEFALEVAEQYAKKMAEDTARPNDWRWGASHLTNIALAAQRTEKTKERGLKLFEDLLGMSVDDARKAAELMNHRESTIG